VRGALFPERGGEQVIAEKSPEAKPGKGEGGAPIVPSSETSTTGDRVAGTQKCPRGRKTYLTRGKTPTAKEMGGKQ